MTREASLTEGGPFHRLMARVGVPRSFPRCWWFGVIFWLPVVLGEGVRRALGLAPDPLLDDLSLHTRLLIALPLLLASERVLEGGFKSAMTSLYKGGYCDPAALERIVKRAEPLRDSWIIEALLLALAVIGGQLVLWRVFGATGWIHGGAAHMTHSFSRIWYATIALPIFEFVMFRWIWRWLIWSIMLARISRLTLAVLATHPDYCAGLGAVARPVSGFNGFVLAIGSLLAGAWGTQLLEHRASRADLLPWLVVFLLASLAVALVPLLLFSGHLFRARKRELAQYGDFARGYTQAFHAKWIAPSRFATQPPLGTPDVQSLNDLCESFQVITKTRLFVFGPRTVISVWVAGIVPMIPLFASTLTVEHVLKRILMTVLGGLPF